MHQKQKSKAKTNLCYSLKVINVRTVVRMHETLPIVIPTPSRMAVLSWLVQADAIAANVGQSRDRAEGGAGGGESPTTFCGKII